MHSAPNLTHTSLALVPQAAAHVKEGKREREQLAFKKQMQLEEARRRRLDDEKAAVKAEATADVFTTLSPLQQEDAARRVRGVLGVSDGGGEEEEEEVHFIPAPRRAQGDGILKVGFSDRPFPTPLRESRHSAYPTSPHRTSNQRSHPAPTPQRKKAHGWQSTRSRSRPTPPGSGRRGGRGPTHCQPGMSQSGMPTG